MSLLREIQQVQLRRYSEQLQVQPDWCVLDVGIGGDKEKPSDNFRLFKCGHFDTLDADASWKPAIVGDICNPPIRSATYDLVLCCQTLEHVWDVKRALWECARILKPGGWLICDVPFMYEYHESPDDYWRISHTALTRLCTEAGLKGKAQLLQGIVTSILCQKPS